MRTIWAIYKKEMNAYCVSPTAYLFSMMFLVITGFFFWLILVDTREASLRGIFPVMGSVMLFVAPILTMRLLAEERKTGTIELLFTSPIKNIELVLGKFLACFSLFSILFSITFCYVVLIAALGKPDLPTIFCGYLGLFLMAACYSSVGLLASSLTENQLVAGILSFGVLLFFLVLDWFKNFLHFEWLISLAGHLSFFAHYENFGKGLLTTPDLIYFLLFIFTGLFLSVRVLEIQRNQ